MHHLNDQATIDAARAARDSAQPTVSQRKAALMHQLVSVNNQLMLAEQEALELGECGAALRLRAAGHESFAAIRRLGSSKDAATPAIPPEAAGA